MASDTYPYVLNNGKIAALFEAIGNAAKPVRFSHEFLKNIGFPSSNDRAFISLFRHLGLISENNSPTSEFDEVRDPQQRPYALGRQIREAYADLFAINTNIHKATDADVRATISRVTGKDADYVSRAYNTFKSLLSLAKFDAPPKAEAAPAVPEAKPADPVAPIASPIPEHQSAAARPGGPMSLNYNIQIHLPATTDISVYNSIFKSLKDTLGIY